MERLSYELISHLQKISVIRLDTLVNKTHPSVPLWASRIRSVFFSIAVIPLGIIHSYRADVVHLGDPVLSLAGWLIKKITGKPIAITVHGLDVSYSSRLYAMYLNMFFRNFDLYLPISNYAKQKLSSRRVQGNVKVIIPGVQDQNFDRSIPRQRLDTVLGQPTAARTILFTIGRLVERKGHEWFIRKVLPSLSPSVLYVIAGDGPERERIMKAAAEVDRKEKVILLGRISHEVRKILYNTGDIFIQPNISVRNDAEGFGLVLLEAALCQRRIIASNIEGLREVVAAGRNGILATSGDAVAWQKAIESEMQKPRLNTEARQHTLDAFSWSKFSDTYAHVLIGLIGSSRL